MYYICFFVLLLFTTSCSQNIKLNPATDQQSSGVVRVTVLSQSTAVADGFADLTVQVLVEDLLGNIVANYRPAIQIGSGIGVNYSLCSLSDSAGHSACLFRSTMSGTKQVSIANTQVAIHFIDSAFLRGSSFAVVPSAQNNVSAGTDKVNATVGAIHDSPRQETGQGVLYTDISVQE